MKVLVCSDGTQGSENAVQLGALLAAAIPVQTVLLGIAETAETEQPLRATLEIQAEGLRQAGSETRLAFISGDPIRQIIAETAVHHYDLVIIGARRRHYGGVWGQSARMYEVIKAIEPPVLVAIGERTRLGRFLVCTGGKHYTDSAVRLAGNLGQALGAEVTILHVMAEPPAIYADLVRMEEDVESLLNSKSELGRTLTAQKKQLEKIGATARVRVRHGIVLEQVFAEVREGNYDLIVSGSSRARGPLRHYIMGDLTRSILNRAECPVLVARSDTSAGDGLFSRWRGLFSKKKAAG